MTNACSFYELENLTAEERARLLKRSETDLASFTERAKPIVEAVRRGRRSRAYSLRP